MNLAEHDRAGRRALEQLILDLACAFRDVGRGCDRHMPTTGTSVMPAPPLVPTRSRVSWDAPP